MAAATATRSSSAPFRHAQRVTSTVKKASGSVRVYRRRKAKANSQALDSSPSSNDSELKLKTSPLGQRKQAQSQKSGQVLDLIDGAAAESRPWWTPLFGFSKQDYNFDGSSSEIQAGEEDLAVREGPLEPAEKFKLLRARLRESESWNDTMYHSAIASRLATKSPD